MKRRHAEKRKDATQKDDKIKISNEVFSHGVVSSFRTKTSPFRMPVSSFYLFAWRYFVFSSFLISFFLSFRMESFRLFAWRLFAAKWHNLATIVDLAINLVNVNVASLFKQLHFLNENKCCTPH